MIKQYIIKNNYEIKEREREINRYYIPLNITFPWEQMYGADIKYIQFFSSYGHLIVKVDDFTKQILEAVLVSCYSFSFYSQAFDDSGLLFLKNNLGLDFNVSLEDYGVTIPLVQDYKVQLHIFNDGVVLLIVQELCPVFVIYESELFAALADKDFNFVGFITKNVSPEDIEGLKDNAKYRLDYVPTPLEVQPPFTCFGAIMENKEALIKKILDLKNIDFIALLYYGLHRELINNTFCVDFAMKALDNQKLATALMAELAGLSLDEIIRDLVPSKLIESSIKDKEVILIEQGQFYNKLWFYLTLAADMYTLNLIE
jgi:hypothetical protein